MKIIKEGTPERFDNSLHIKLDKPKTFYCSQCGCEFEANKTEYFRKLLITFRCHCPQCGYEAKEVTLWFTLNT